MVTGTPAIRIRGLGRYFGPRVEIDGVARPREAWRMLLRIAGLNVRQRPDDEIQATVAVAGHVLRDITLDIEHGSVVCLAGAGGSGKSVLLQILAGRISPTAGSVEIYGAVGTLLAIGDNLDMRRTAHENIRASTGFLGAPPDEAARFAADVISFAGLEGFEQVPIRTYSTGMTMRLSAALALCGRPSVVLIDDVLAVGDIAFQQQCIDRVHELKAMGCTLLLVSSDPVLVQQLATRVITLGGGRVTGDTPARSWEQAPRASSAAEVEWRVLEDLPENEVVALRSVGIAAGRDEDDTYVNLSLGCEAKAGDLRCRPTVSLLRDAVVIFRSLYPEFLDVSAPRSFTVSVKVPTHILRSGDYTAAVSVVTLRGKKVYSMKAYEAVSLKIRRGDDSSAESKVTPMLAMTLPWEVETVAGGAA